MIRLLRLKLSSKNLILCLIGLTWALSFYLVSSDSPFFVLHPNELIVTLTFIPLLISLWLTYFITVVSGLNTPIMPSQIETIILVWEHFLGVILASMIVYLTYWLLLKLQKLIH